MKIKIIYLLGFCLFFPLVSLSQKNIIKAGFLSNGGTNYGLQYERQLNDRISIIGQFGFVYLLNNVEGFDSNLDFLYGTGLYLEGRYYFSNKNKPLNGWHGGLYFNYLNTIFESDVSNDYLKRTGAGTVFGYQKVFSKHLTLDLLFGGSLMKTSTNLTDYRDGFFPLFGLNFGYNF